MNQILIQKMCFENLITGKLSSETKKSFDCHCTSLVPCTISYSKIICPREIKRSRFHCQCTSGK